MFEVIKSDGNAQWQCKFEALYVLFNWANQVPHTSKLCGFSVVVTETTNLHGPTPLIMAKKG